MQSINLVNGSNQVLATLGPAPNGGGSLTFFDSIGDREILVGVSDTGTQAGLLGFDGNALASGAGVERDAFGISGSTSPVPGFGMGIAGASGTTSRLIVGSSLDGTTLPSGIELFDGSGTFRTGIQVNPATNYVGFFSGIYTATSINESLIGNAYDNSASYGFLYDSSGNLRNGIEYNPSVNFNGFFSDAAANAGGVGLSAIGNFLTTNSSVQANESVMSLSDATGTLRLLEFQDGASNGTDGSTEGGVIFNSGSTTAAGSWGNP